MKPWSVSLLALLLAACATAPVPSRTEALLHDGMFRAPSERVNVADVFAINDDMLRFVKVDIGADISSKGSRQALIDALYTEGQLKLEYDSVVTRNAAQAFAARSGNCLSLVIMTAAFAKELGLPVRFQSATASESWSRIGGVEFFIGHVNLTLGSKGVDIGFGRTGPNQMTIDFLSPQEMRGLATHPISEATVVAMYMNNRAAEALTRGSVDDAYWWARGAILHNPHFVSAYNTLGIVYQRHGNLPEAEATLAHALEQDPANTRVMSNLASVLGAEGRVAEAQALTRKLEALEPNPPFRYMHEGMAALRRGDYRAARELFAREVERAPYNDEFHYWLAVADVGLGNTESARRELAKALEYSTSRQDHDLYASKLARIRHGSSP